MIDANSQFFAILTNVGMAKQANADALGIPWKITDMGVGDASGTDPIPNAAQTKLINEWRRRPLNQLKIDPNNPAVIIAEQIIPADEGGKWIREIGLYDADGDLVAVANCAPSFKPVLSQGSGRTQIVRMNFIVTSVGNITLKIDPAIVLASRAYVDAAILEVLPANKTPGVYRLVTVNNRGVVVAGDNPETLAGFGIKDTYTKPEIEAIVAQASALPVGAMVAFPKSAMPPGFLEVNGSVKSAAQYPDLFAYLGTTFNTGGEGAGNFRLPESRGEFLRGWDNTRGVDAGRAVGSYQLDDLKSHAHEYPFKAGLSNSTYGDKITVPSNLIAGSPSAVIQATSASGGAETRPRNLAVMWCIKAWNAPINQGNIDIAALEAEVQALRKLPIAGHKGLMVSATGTNALIAIRARSLIVGAGALARALERLDLSISLATVGLGGLDAGVVAASSWYSIWVATNGDVTAGIAALMPVITGTTTAGSAVVPAIASTALMRPGMQFGGANFPPGAFIKSVDSPTQITASIPAIASGVGAALRFVYEPVLPAGYSAVRVSTCLTDATANKFPLSYQQFGRMAFYKVAVGSNVAALPLMVSGVQGTANALVAVSTLQFVPPTAIGIALQLIGETSSNSAAAPNASYVGGLGGQNSPPLNSVGSTSTQRNTQGYFLLEEPRVYYFGQGTAGLMCYGWEDDV